MYRFEEEGGSKEDVVKLVFVSYHVLFNPSIFFVLEQQFHLVIKKKKIVHV